MSPEDFHWNVLQTIRRWNMLPDENRVGIAVSGGSDSVALFRTLVALSGSQHWYLHVLHVNHGLRGAESDADEEFVRALAHRHHLPCEVAKFPLTGNGNLEQEARRLRYQWWSECTIRHNLHKVAVGHTQSDQAETVLFRFLRGSGVSGLAAIRPALQTGIVRPLIETSRATVRDYLGCIDQPFREDSTNQDAAFDRNRLRIHLLPQLAREWNPAIERTLAQTAQRAQAEEEYWDTIVLKLADEHFSPGSDSAVVLRVDLLRTLPLAVSRRLIREAIRRVSGDLLSIDFGHVERIRALLDASEGSGRLQIPGIDVMRSFDWVRFAIPGTYGGERHRAIPASVPGTTALTPKISLMLKIENADYRYNKYVNCFDADRVPNPLVLRTWQPGDRYRPIGRGSTTKIKTLFQEARVPLWDRHSWPVLAANCGGRAEESIVWTRHFGVANEFAAGPATRRVAVVYEREDKIVTASPKLESEPDVRRL